MNYQDNKNYSTTNPLFGSLTSNQTPSSPYVQPLIQNQETNMYENKLSSIENSISEISIDRKKERKIHQERIECCWTFLATFVIMNAIGIIIGLLIYYYHLSKK